MRTYLKSVVAGVVMAVLAAAPVGATVVIVDTTSVGGCRVVPEKFVIVQADTVRVWLELTTIHSTINYVDPPFPPNRHSIIFHVKQAGGLFFNEFVFEKQFSQTFLYVPGGAGIVDLGAELAMNNPPTAQPKMKLGFYQNGILYESPWVITPLPPGWGDTAFWPIQDASGNNPPQNADGLVEIDNLVIKLKSYYYDVEDAVLYIDNIKTDDKHILDTMGDGDFTTGIEPGAVSAVPQGYALSATVPNPFNPTTTFTFSLPHRDEVTIAIYDVVGRVVETETATLPAGTYPNTFLAHNLSSGIYFYAMTTASGYRAVRKMVLAR